jgi:hypothetical protein
LGTLWSRSNSYEWDSNHDPAEGALVYFFDAGTSTPRAVYTTAALSTPHEHPVEADGNGRWPAIFLQFGDYKETATTAGGAQLWTTDNIPNPEPFDESFTLDTTTILNTGDYIFSGANGARTGAVRCNGKTIGNATSGGTERANADTSALFAYLWNNYADAQAAVSTGRGATAAADFAASKTIALPDHRGAHVVGFDDMGSTASGNFAGVPGVSGNGSFAGSIIGANTHTLLTAETPAHTHSFSATTGAGSAHSHTFSDLSTVAGGSHTHTGTTDSGGVDHTHSYTDALSKTGTFTGPGSNGWGGTAAATTGAASAYLHTHTFTTGSSGSHTHAMTATMNTESSHTHSVSGTTGSIGSGSAHNNLSRSVPVTILLKL